MNSHMLLMNQPAVRWEDATPCGNGHIGAMIYGAIGQERILLNHENLWLPLFGKPALPSMAKHLAQYRRLMEQFKFQEADAFYREKLKEEGWPDLIYTDPFHPACDLLIDYKAGAAFTHYRRTLDFTTGEAVVSWKENGLQYTRSMFVSRADGVVVVHMSAAPRRTISAGCRFAPHPMHETMRKALHYPRPYSMEEIPLSFETSAAGPWLRMAASYTAGDRKGYCSVARIISSGGILKTSGDSVCAEEAREILILIAVCDQPLTTDTEHHIEKNLNTLPAHYKTLLCRHAKLHNDLYRRVHFDLGAPAAASNETLLSDAYKGTVPNTLVEILFNYGRYLFISSSVPGGLPPNLQGVWNGDYIPAWSSDYTTDENVQMNHWHVLPSNYPELLRPYFDYFERSVPDWRRNAEAFFGCRGVYTCLRQSNHGLMAENMPYMIWSEGAGWLALRSTAAQAITLKCPRWAPSLKAESHRIVVRPNGRGRLYWDIEVPKGAKAVLECRGK